MGDSTRTIHKFHIPLDDRPDVEMPLGARIVAIREVDRQLYAWAEVDTRARMAVRELAVVGTGHPLPPLGRHLETVPMRSGFVWHVYELGER